MHAPAYTGQCGTGSGRLTCWLCLVCPGSLPTKTLPAPVSMEVFSVCVAFRPRTVYYLGITKTVFKESGKVDQSAKSEENGVRATPP